MLLFSDTPSSDDERGESNNGSSHFDGNLSIWYHTTATEKAWRKNTIPWLYIYLPLHCHQPRMVPPLRQICFWKFWQIEKDCVRGERGGNRQNTGWFTGREGLSPLEQLRLSFPASLFTDWQFQMDCLRKQKRLTYFLSCWNLRHMRRNISLLAYLWQVTKKKIKFIASRHCNVNWDAHYAPAKKLKRSCKNWIHYSTFASFSLTRDFSSHKFVYYLMC